MGAYSYPLQNGGLSVNLINKINHYFFDLEDDEQLPLVSDALFFYIPILIMPVIAIGIWFI